MNLTKVEQNLVSLSEHVLHKLDSDISEIKEKSSKTALDKAYKKKV